ncbi:hypothetical protein TELCIR_14587, partial [Teladorsagia circumcincta]
MKFLPFTFLVFISSCSSSPDDLLTQVVDNLLKSIRAEHHRTLEPKAIGNDWFAIEVDAADCQLVESIARSAGFVIEGRLQSFENIYLASKRGRQKRSTEEIVEELISLKEWSSPPNMLIPETWAQGLTGRGVNVAVLDDDIDSSHEDLKPSYDPSISHSFVRRQARGSDETFQGRRGLGSLYVWASGNGGLENDDCAMDGYASNLHT